jgi:hypothetical protein
MFAHPGEVVGFDVGRAKRAGTALAIVVAGAGLGVAIAERDASQAITVDSLTMRAAQMDSHLGTLTVTGQAQIGAMREAELLQQRINTGLVQQAAIDALVGSGPEAGRR